MFGILHSILLAAILYAVISAGFLFGCNKRLTYAIPAIMVVFASVAWWLPPWDKALMSSGVYHQPRTFLDGLNDKSLDELVSQSNLLYYAEGLDGAVAVIEDETKKILTINGKHEANTLGGMPSQIIGGQLGALIHPNPENALVIGLGSGITTGSLATHASIRDITVLEMLPEVVRAAEYFSAENHRILDDPRLNLVSADARNYVLATDRQWDLIVSIPSNPWVSGVSNLFTRDFFQLIRQKLALGGVMTQWFHFYGMTREDVKSILRSYADSFPYVTVWHVPPGEMMITGSNEPHALDMQRLQEAFSESVIGADLKRADLHTPQDVIRQFLIANTELRRFVANGRYNLDMRPLIEFSAPRSLYSHSANANLVDLVTHIEGQALPVPLTNQFNFVDPSLMVHFMGLKVDSTRDSSINGVQSSWQVWRDLVDTEGKKLISLGDRRELSWQEHGSGILVDVLRHSNPPVDAFRDRTMLEALAVSPVTGGLLERRSDAGARWVMGKLNGSNEIRFVLWWICPQSGGGIDRFLVLGEQPDPGVLNRELWVNSFANRFQCTQ